MGGGIFAYDAAEVEDDALMLSGPNTLAPASDPPVSWPNPGPGDTWDGPYGPLIVDWNNTSHPGAHPGPSATGWSPPNKALKYDSAIPGGWYSRISKRDPRDRFDRPVPTLNDPNISD